MDFYQRVYLTCPAHLLKNLPPFFSPDFTPTVLANLGLPDLHGVKVVGLPVREFKFTVPAGTKPPKPRQEVVQLLFTEHGSLGTFIENLPKAKRGVEAGADLPFGASDYVDYWCPIGTGAGTSFGTRKAAIQQMNAGSLHSMNGVSLDGSGVNIVLVDRGIAANALPAANQGSGWGWKTQSAFTATGEQAEHSAMLIRDIRAIASAPVFWDMPLIPPRVQKVQAFLSDAHAAFLHMKALIKFYNSHIHGKRWVIVNAWATFDLRSDANHPSWLRYRDNSKHIFHHAVGGLVHEDCDVIFAAGNCGEFCPDDRCGPADIGPGNSISGANGYKEVLSVGAVRADGLALGYSSQGKGRITWTHGGGSGEKPDIVAPSQYRLETDPGRISSGTSAACGLAAGVVAALRTQPVGTNVSPADLIAELRASAGGTYDRQFGCGMLNADKARSDLGI
jgi:hypothetical protein